MISLNPKGKAKKRLLFLIAMAIALLVAAVPTLAWAAGPTDISGHWAQERIAAWVGQDLIKGYPDGTFRPDRSITRAEFMALVNRSFGYSHGSGSAFKDVPAGSWFAGEVAKAVAAGYAGGYPDGTVRPNNPITRAEAAAMIALIKGLAPDTSAAGKFADAAGIPAWSKGAIGAAVGGGIMGGYPDGSFRADSPITRAEAVTALTKALAVVYDKAGTYGPVAGTATVIGDLTIKTRDVTLQNTLVLGDLIVDRAVGDGNVTLKNVVVRGATYVYGGGVSSVYFIDSSTGRVYVARDDGPVRIVVTGSTEIKDLSLGSAVKVEETDLTGTGIAGITVEQKIGGAIEIELRGVKADSLDIRSPGITIKADGATDIQKLTVKADNVTVQTEKGTNITTLVADGKVSVTGQGTIEKAEVKVSGVSFETKPLSQDVANGATPPTTGSATAGGGDGGSSNGGSSGGEGGLTVTATAITDANVSIACGSIDYDYDFAVNGQPVTYAQALQAPYYLDPDTSTVTLSDGTNRSNAVTISSLGLDNDGRKSYSGTQEMNSDFVINGAWFPTQVNIVLKSKTSIDGKSVTNPWEKTFTIDINEDLEVFKINADAEYVFLRDTQLNPVGDIVTGDLRLIAAGQMNSVITWQSSDPCIQIGNISNGFYPAAVTRDDRQQKTVTLTATLTLGSQSLTKAFTVTVPAKETLMVSASDASIPLNGDYKTPQAIKNYWLLMITNSNPAITVKDNISTAAVTVAQDAPLPNGFTYSVAKNGPREIKITLEGEASALVTGSTEVRFIVSPEAVIEPGFKESGPVTVYINPPGTGGPKISVDTGNSDHRLKMQDGNIQPDPADNSWVLKISEPQIKEGVSLGDINITNLPDGLGVQTVTLDQQINSITITIGGTASEPLVSPVNVGIVVKAGAANDTGYEDSEQITAVIEPYSFSLTDEQKVAADKAALTDDLIKGGNTALDNVTVNLNLVTSIPGGAGCSISWVSDNEIVIATDGTVTRPAYRFGNALVNLTATITNGSASDTKVFTVIVKEEEPTFVTVSSISNVTLAVYGSTDVAVTTSPADAVVTAVSSDASLVSVSVYEHTVSLEVYGKAGTATVTVTASKSGYNNGSRSFTVTVMPDKPASFTLGTAAGSLYIDMSGFKDRYGNDIVWDELRSAYGLDPANSKIYLTTGDSVTSDVYATLAQLLDYQVDSIQDNIPELQDVLANGGTVIYFNDNDLAQIFSGTGLDGMFAGFNSSVHTWVYAEITGTFNGQAWAISDSCQMPAIGDDVTLNTFNLGGAFDPFTQTVSGGYNVLELVNLKVTDPINDQGATLNINGPANGIIIIPTDPTAMSAVTVNGITLDMEGLPARVIQNGDVIVVVVTAQSGNTAYYKMTAVLAADKTALTAAVTAEIGEDHNNPVYVLTAADYTAGSWSAYAGAITAAIAVEANPSSTQAEIDNAVAAIDAAKAGLVFAGQAELDAAKAAAEALNEEDYTAESWAVLQEALEMPEGTNAEVVEKTTAINDAIAGLVTVAEAVAADKAALTEEVIKGGNAALDNVTVNLNLVTSIPDGAGCSISWASSDPSVIATDGTVTRPAYGSGDATVTLTATITSGSASDTKEFTVTVKQEERLTVAAVTNDSDNNTNVDAAKDSSGNIHLVYLKSGNAYYRKYTAGQGWGTEEQIGNSVLQAAIAADSAGNPHIAYVNTSGAINYIARESGSWSSPQTVLSSGGANVDLDIGPSGTVHFVFEGNLITDDSYAEIGYRTYSNGTFSGTEILFDGFYWYENGGKTGRYYYNPCIKADSSGNYHVVVKHHALDGAIGWTDHNYYLVYKANAGAGLEIGSESNGNAEMGMSNNPIVLTGSGAVIVYNDRFGAVNIARPAGMYWNKTQVASGTGASIDVAAPGSVKITYTASGNLYYMEEGSAGEQIDSGLAGGVGYPVVLDTGTKVYVLYVKSDGSDNEVYCAAIAG